MAPEVWTVPTDGPYTAKIDMWAYGYAIAEVLGYSVGKYPGQDVLLSNNPQITHNRHAAILIMLRDHCGKAAEDKPLVDLVSKLLVWEPEKRWSADQALEHECWNTIIHGQEEEEDKESLKDDGKAEMSWTKRMRFENSRLGSDGYHLLTTGALAYDTVSAANALSESPHDTQEFSQATKDFVKTLCGR